MLRPDSMCRYGLDLGSAAKGEMQVATRQGNGADLNIWVTSINSGGVIGWVCAASTPSASIQCAVHIRRL
jgi:hypothetical protein